MSSLRPRSVATKQPSLKETNNDAPTPSAIDTDSDSSKAPPQRQPSVQQRATQTLTSTAANLANLLPTGTLLAFQILTPIFTNNGACDSATRYMTLVLLVLLALSCFLASFTDSIKASDGRVYYGFTTFKGLWLFDYPDASGAGLPDLSKFRIRAIDGIHAVLSVLVFGAVAMRDRNVFQCLYPQPGQQTQEVWNIVPVGVGFICSLLFVVFPTSRHGIGYPVTPGN
ncbi:protein DMP5-like [Juglans microcarpa x Juglans regia]|uniref:protein DMP5-like n=1 Tax=Juglans microcarpa x Juglans regia TaxID=2249226 RepID=UPI001B7D926B|nr:protein DMP5-like [Juglans microcarpa x Juglans regia]